MTVDLTVPGQASLVASPLIAAVADDELTARRIEGVLAADGMIVETRGLSVEDLGHGSAVDPDVLVVAFGRGVIQPIGRRGSLTRSRRARRSPGCWTERLALQLISKPTQPRHGSSEVYVSVPLPNGQSL